MVKSHHSNFAQERRAGLGASAARPGALHRRRGAGLCIAVAVPGLPWGSPSPGTWGRTSPGFVPLGEEEPKWEELTFSYVS